MTEEERQALAVAENLRSLARGYAERRQCAIALSLSCSALEWTKRAGEGIAAKALRDQLLRERAALRQEQARQYDGGELTIPGGARK
jgi:hypothetical protein